MDCPPDGGPGNWETRHAARGRVLVFPLSAVLAAEPARWRNDEEAAEYRFGMKIWQKLGSCSVDGPVVYDNGADATGTILSGGNIQIHKGNQCRSRAAVTAALLSTALLFFEDTCMAERAESNSAVVEAEVLADRSDKASRTAELKRLGGAKGGRARAAALTAKQRRDISLKAAHARWGSN